MEIRKPFNLNEWVKKNRAILKPPVGNKNLFVDSGDYIVMIVGGPNARKDYHYNETEELFYQLEGTIQIALQTKNGKEIVTLNPGDIFLLPAKVPHSPVRSEGSVGLVVEVKREYSNLKDGLLWFCEHCNEKLHEVYFKLNNIEADFLPHFKHFYQSEELKKCKKCGNTMEADPRFIG